MTNVGAIGDLFPRCREQVSVDDRGELSAEAGGKKAVEMLFGLPAHPLLVHLTVVAIPSAAVLVGVVAVFPRGPRLVRVITVLLAASAVALVPLMDSSGKALEERVTETAAVERHAEMGETLLPWVIGLFVMIVILLAADRRLRPAMSDGPGSQTAAEHSVATKRLVRIGAAVVAIVVAVGTVVQTVRIGHSGAQATWSTVGGSMPGTSEQDEG